MVTTRSKLILILGISLMACAIGSAWALLNSAEGRAGVGIYSLTVRENHEGETWIEAEFYHDGYIEDTRDETRKALGKRRYATFQRGAAIFPDDYDDNGDDRRGFGQHNNHTDVDKDNITRQKKHSWITSTSVELEEGDIAPWTAWSYVEMEVNHPSEWWVAAVTYSGYGSRQGSPTDMIKAVSEYDIDRDTPVQYNRSLYRESIVWGNDDLGRWSSWPW